MIKSGTKRMIVLRDIPSNIIEEAILILKNDNSIEEKNLSVKNKLEKKKDFLIIREAEMIINSFCKESTINPKNSNIQKIVGKKWYLDFILNAGLICGIGILIFLIIKAF